MLTLHIDRARFDANIKSVLVDVPGLVPVAKGNGYGLGLERCADEVVRMGVDSIAVATYPEAVTVLRRQPGLGRVLVMNPHLPGAPVGRLEPALAGPVVHTITTPQAAAELTGRRCVVEFRTPLRRHGATVDDVPRLKDALGPVRCEGIALHLPMRRPGGYDPVAEIASLIELLNARGLPTGTVYVSHMGGAELATLGTRFPGSTFRARIGTRLWLGDRGALTARATVLDTIEIHRGDRYGYRQMKATRSGHLLVVAGGTAHGVGLAAPKPVAGPLSRVRVLAEGALAAANRTLSPFVVAGRRRWFAETPHMQVSLLFLPAGAEPPKVGEEVELTTRMTTTHFDAVVEG